MERRQLHVPLPINSSTTASSGHPFSFTVNRLDSLEHQDTLLSDQACFGIDSDTDSLGPSRLKASEPKRKFIV
ncbi:hypothetical protein ARMSODRAFT_958236 [Armillaria solidipes]|uniref:Uncharacterized protein n=1 Tax=Armillaria solidipes TaxID=1076256 RepID=A0A2H3BRB2_9AGAR|nr:hypothetical protein ARMSODRAFT_958236 [Armillaria solidipes]